MAGRSIKPAMRPAGCLHPLAAAARRVWAGKPEAVDPVLRGATLARAAAAAAVPVQARATAQVVTAPVQLRATGRVAAGRVARAPVEPAAAPATA